MLHLTLVWKRCQRNSTRKFIGNKHIPLENCPRYQIFLSQRLLEAVLRAQFCPDPWWSPCICPVHCCGAELQCPWANAIPVLILNMTPARLIPLAPLWLILGVRQPSHSCSSLLCCIISYFCSVYHTLTIDFLPSILKSPSLHGCPALGSCSTVLVIFPNLPLLFFSHALYPAMR